MKLRVKGNSIRIRLSKSEITTFESLGNIAETTQFPGQTFIYCLQRAGHGKELHATLENNMLTVMMPEELVEEWVNSDVVGYKSEMRLGNTGSLSILVEKDFQCLDETVEDQSDNFENPRLK